MACARCGSEARSRGRPPLCRECERRFDDYFARRVIDVGLLRGRFGAALLFGGLVATIVLGAFLGSSLWRSVGLGALLGVLWLTLLITVNALILRSTKRHFRGEFVRSVADNVQETRT